MRGVEYEAGAGEARFGLLEFGNVERRNVKAARFDAGACAREGSGKNDRAAERQGIGGMRLCGINIDPCMAEERLGVKPATIGEEGVAAEMRDGRFQMQAAGDGNGDDFIVVRRKNSGKPANAFRVAALGEADKELSADAQGIAAFESAGKRNIFKLSKPGESVSQRL